MTGWSGPKDQKDKTGKFLSPTGTPYVLVISQEDQVKMLKEHILKHIVPYAFAGIHGHPEIQE